MIYTVLDALFVAQILVILLPKQNTKTVRASTFSSKKLLNDATASALKDVVLASGDFDQIDMLKHMINQNLAKQPSP